MTRQSYQLFAMSLWLAIAVYPFFLSVLKMAPCIFRKTSLRAYYLYVIPKAHIALWFTVDSAPQSSSLSLPKNY
ncbi:MAG: hypothetical protein ACJ71O_09280 [Nitrososphaeraceae archaeon]